jgi:SAM-dependent methyltransferase
MKDKFETGDGAALLGALADEYYAADDFTKKGMSYFHSYARLFDGRRNARLRILELGIFSGASLLVWRRYLPNAIIVGLDINDAPSRVSGIKDLYTLKGSQDNGAVLDEAASIAGGQFDVIIDDASHIGYLTKRSFLHLFPRWLVPGGTYVIEDFGTGFIPAYPDGQEFAEPPWDDTVPDATEFRSSQFGMVGVVKQLVEPMMQPLMTGRQPYLAIDQLIIETNIAFIRKGQIPNGPMPEVLRGAR